GGGQFGWSGSRHAGERHRRRPGDPVSLRHVRIQHGFTEGIHRDGRTIEAAVSSAARRRKGDNFQLLIFDCRLGLIGNRQSPIENLFHSGDSSAVRYLYFLARARQAASGFMPAVQLGSEREAAAAQTPASSERFNSHPSCKPSKTPAQKASPAPAVPAT